MSNPFKKPEPVRVDIDGIPVLIRPLTAGELANVLHVEKTMKDAAPWRANFLLVSLCVLDTQGRRLFPTAEDAEALDQATAAKLLEACVTTNSIGQTDAKKNI